MRSRHSLMCCVLAVTWVNLSGCILTSEESAEIAEQAKPQRLKDLTLAPVRIEREVLPPTSLRQVRDQYRELLSQVKNKDILADMTYRAADLEMLLAEQAQEQGESVPSANYYQTAIDEYRQLLANYPLAPDNEQVLYQLSRAYDLQGQGQQAIATLEQLQQRFSNSRYVQESDFRIGEHYYAQGDYRQASDAYQRALHSKQHDYRAIAAYMLGWSELKRQSYQTSLQAFSQMLDISLARINLNDINGPLAQLGKGSKKQVQDTLRVMALLFSYQGSGEAIIDFYSEYGARDYVYLVFDELAQQYLDDSRFKDSADTYLSFATWQPQHDKAPEFYIKHIDAYVLGDFPTLVLPAKQGFVETYGVNGAFYSKWQATRRQQVHHYLQTYLTELAQSEHSLAQTLAQQLSDTTRPDMTKRISKQSQQAFLNASRWYQEYIDTFDDDTAVQMRFYLAEALRDAGRHKMAIAAYERFAYQYSEHADAADAAFNALLTYASLIDKNPSADWLQKRQLSREAFVKTFDQDPRALDVAEVMMQSRFDEQDYHAASHWAQWLLAQFSDGEDDPAHALKERGAQLVLSHSQFALEQYVQAEVGYRTLLASISADDEESRALRERLAATMFKQTEQALVTEDFTSAIAHLQRILTDTPDTLVRTAAQFDLSTYLLRVGNYAEAIIQLSDFAQRFPEHESAGDIPGKLLFAYEQSGRWLPAANMLLQRWQQQPDSDTGREALYLAAEYFQRGGETDKARLTLRDYAHSYPQPFDLAVEARFRMSEFYRHSGEDSKRRFWLQKLIDIDKQAAQRTQRSRYLAAMSALVFADDARHKFDTITLSLPLERSLSKKRSAMQTALARYQQVVDYGIAEFSSAATFQLGEIYRRLATDLMDSSRPQGLSALELSQYDMLLEEQAFPFEEQAIDLHELNAQRSWQGLYDQWVQHSLDTLAQLVPARYQKSEIYEELSL